MIDHKSNTCAETLKNDGNEFYKQRKFFDALLKYNESLCHAEPGTPNLGNAYANRSAVYLELKLFDNCLKNIELARTNNYPEENLNILKLREEKCKEMKKVSRERFSDPWTTFKLSYPPNSKVPFIANCLEVKSSEKFGRFVVTNRQLKSGDIVAIETPFCSVLNQETTFYVEPECIIHQKCSNCLKDNSLDLIPCEKCCKAMYCSASCLQEAYDRYHRYECPIMDKLFKFPNIRFILRQFLIGLSIFRGSIEKFESFITKNHDMNVTIFDFEDSHGFSKQEQGLLALRSLVKSSRNFSLQNYEKMFIDHPELDEVWKNHKDFIGEFINRQCQVADLNYMGIFGGSSRKCESEDVTAVLNNMQQPIGNGSLLFGSFINHSCSNNVFRVYVEGKVVYIVNQPVAKGSQLFDCYKMSFLNQQKPERQERLMKEFGFICDCEACIKNFPTPPSLQAKDAKLLKVAKKSREDILRLNPGQTMKRFMENCNHIEKNFKNYPSAELCILQKSLVTCLVKQAQPVVKFS